MQWITINIITYCSYAWIKFIWKFNCSSKQERCQFYVIIVIILFGLIASFILFNKLNRGLGFVWCTYRSIKNILGCSRQICAIRSSMHILRKYVRSSRRHTNQHFKDVSDRSIVKWMMVLTQNSWMSRIIRIKSDRRFTYVEICAWCYISEELNQRRVAQISQEGKEHMLEVTTFLLSPDQTLTILNFERRPFLEPPFGWAVRYLLRCSPALC